MRYMVFADPDNNGDDMHWFQTRHDVNNYVQALFGRAELSMNDGKYPAWIQEVTVLQVVAEVRQVPFDSDYRLVEVR